MKTPGPWLIGILLGAAGAAFSSAAGAQALPDAAEAEPAPASRFSCEEQEKFREFDFWIGTWDVHTADGRFAGRNVIESSQRGCVLIENWTGTGGSTGTSINYFDAAAEEWVQVWTDAGGGQITIRGGMTDAGMLLEGQIHDTSNGNTAPFRGLWTAQPDGRVRQFFEQSNDGGETWEPWFEGYYSRADTAGRSEVEENDG
jgi:hypothetical protein